MLSLFKDYPQLLRGRPGNPFFVFPAIFPARALRALGLLLADGAPTVGRG